MMQKLLRSASLLLAINVGAFTHAEVLGAVLTLSDCQLTSESVKGSATARCGFYSVPEDRRAPDGKVVRLHVAVVPALRKEPLADPVVILTGGPGQAASDFYLSGATAFDRLRRNRDIVLVDQRGTGKSNRLDCELPDELTTAELDASLMQKFAKDCLEALSGDPRFYTTSVAVRDLDEIRDALGYAAVNLYGISYGTRVAQHYLRRFPTRVRSVVLDGVVPVDEILGPQIAAAAQNALDNLFARCQSQDACNRAFPDIGAKFSELHRRLTRAPTTIVLPNPLTGEQTSERFALGHLAVAVRLLSYSDDTASLLPFLISEAWHGRPIALAAQASMAANKVSDQLANGMHNAVICTEDTPFYTAHLLSNPVSERAYLGRIFTDMLVASCQVWPRGMLDDDFHAPLQSTVPALILSGENDPVTPSTFGERAAKSYPRGRHVVFKGQGHGQLGSRCGISLLTRFIETADAIHLDTECVERVKPTPFMLNANGPSP